MIKKGWAFLLFLMIFPLVSAFTGFGGYNSAFDFIMNSEGFKFALVFLLFFAVIFFAVSKTFRDEKGIAVVVALVISLFISMALAQRGLLYGYLGDTIGGWAITLALLLGVVFIIKLSFDKLGGIGASIIIFLLWISLFFVDPYDYFSGGGFGDFLISIHNLLTSFVGFITIVVVCIILIAVRARKKSILEKLTER